jgi:hypothetical protein
VDEHYDKSVKGTLSETKPSSPTWTTNMFAIGPLLQYSLTDPRGTPRWLLAAHPIDYIGQITNTNLSLSGDPKTSTAPPFNISQLASRGFSNKVGMRYESGNSFFEVGGIHTRYHDVLSALDGLKGIAAPCILSGSQTPAKCVGGITYLPGDQAPTLRYSTFDQSGFYWDSRFSLDVLKGRWAYVFDSHGNYLLASDSVSTLTRLDATLGNSLQFQLIGNFGLAPKVEWRFFENQGAFARLKRVKTSVALTYNFHKDSRVKLLDAMKYKSSSATAP